MEKQNRHVTSVVRSSSSSSLPAPSATTTTVPINLRPAADGGGSSSAMGLVGGLVDAMRRDGARPAPSSAGVGPSGGRPPQQQKDPLSKQQERQDHRHLGKQVDFIGPANAVKDLFSLPYSNDVGVSVALHNLGDGTLLLDAADEGVVNIDDERQSGGANRQQRSRGRRRPRPTPSSSRSESHSAARSGEDGAAEDSASYFPAPPRPDSNDADGTMAIVSAMLQQNSLGLNGALPDAGGAALESASGPSIEKVSSTDTEGGDKSSGALTREDSLTLLSHPTTATAISASSASAHPPAPPSDTAGDRRGGDRDHPSNDGPLNLVRPPEFYVDSSAGVPSPQEPRQYLNWKFHEMNLVVASDAMIYRAPNNNKDNNNNNNSGGTEQEQNAAAQAEEAGADDSPPPSSRGPRINNDAMSQSLTVRVADAEDLRSKLRVHRDMVEGGRNALAPEYDHHGHRSDQRSVQQGQQPEVQEQKQFYPSYASALLSENCSAKRDGGEEEVKDKDAAAAAPVPESAADDGAKLLQTRIIPSTGVSPELREVGFVSAPSLLASSVDSVPTGKAPLDAAADDPAASSVPLSSPVCTVLDAYLDNIMANVPQLALCLKEKGFIQSVKLLRTEEIPTSMMNSTTLGMDDAAARGLGMDGPADGEPLFSPHMVDMNATMLLRFLKANCSRDNATYLLRRNAGEANIQLYDITSISTQRQKKWIWWLAMMSYRFALRLGQLSRSVVPDEDRAMKRSFRARQRSLFQNALELLEELADMDGGRHETICAAVNEHLADTYLWNDSRPEERDDRDGERTEKEERSDVKAQARDRRDEDASRSGPNPPPPAQPIPTTSPLQPYGNVTTDALNKAQDHLLGGIRKLSLLLEKERDSERARQSQAIKKKQRRCQKDKPSKGARMVIVHNDDSSSSSSDEEDGDGDISFPATPEIEAISMQLHGLLHKLINVSLRLAGHHLRNYWSSSAMQELRTAARKIADAVSLLQPLGLLFVDEKTSPSPFLQSLRYQYAWLWEYCGHFARSFASDELWRERGHACGDDVVSLLRDVEAACCYLSPDSPERLEEDSALWIGGLADDHARASLIASKSKGLVSLRVLNPLVAAPVDFEPLGMKDLRKCHGLGHNDASAKPGAVEMAHTILDSQIITKRDQRLVLVAASICYSRAVATFIKLLSDQNSSNESEFGRYASDEKSFDAMTTPPPMKENVINPVSSSNVHIGPPSRDSSILSLLRQRLGDTCNEIGKILLAEVKTLLETPFEASEVSKERLQATGPLLLSAKFWFNEGLHQFNECKDLCNIALLRCNLCQCCKMRANANVALPKLSEGTDGSTHAEACLKQAADHLQAAHEMLGERDVDPLTWDMVSTELAATLLVLGVRRRQSLLGSGTTPVVIQALRLNPGKERDIIEPIEKAVKIYTTIGNALQAAAANYQLALFYSKVWTCQRDETKTREKLSAAFKHFGAAHQYFYSAMSGNEPTFVILSLDFSNLYSAVSGQKECAEKALMCCIDTCDAFAPEAIRAASERQALRRKGPASADNKEWFEKMSALAAAVEERILKLLQNLAKIEKGSTGGTELYKRMYRIALLAKMAAKKTEKNPTKEDFAIDPNSCSFEIHGMLKALKAEQKKK